MKTLLNRTLPLLPLVCVLLAVAAVANRTVPRLSTIVLHPVPIETFPRTVAGWTSVSEQNADTPLLPHAHAIQRECLDTRGQRLSLLLLTSRDYSDFHDPNTCMPLQGFTLSPVHTVHLPGTNQEASVMTATRRNEQLQILYWWPGGQTLRTKYGHVEWGKLLALRDRLTGEQGRSLFVRLICPATPTSEARLTQTAAAWEPELDALRRRAK